MSSLVTYLLALFVFASNMPTLTVSRGAGGLMAFSRHNRGAAEHAYYHTDAGGNVVAMVNGYQNVVARYLYEPYGASVAMMGPWADANPFRFASQYQHAQTGLQAYAHRFYDPGLQRWLTPDPLGEGADSNLYRFVGNDPVNCVDPLGLDYHYVTQMNIFGAIPAPNGITPYVVGDTWGERMVAAINNAGALVSNIGVQGFRNLDVLQERFEGAVHAPGISMALPVLAMEAAAMRSLKLVTRTMCLVDDGAAAEATAGTGLKLAGGAQDMVAGTQNGILLGTVENGQVNLFQAAAGQIEGHADLLKAGLASPGAQGFSIGVQNGQVSAIFQNSILNPASANYLLPAQTTQQILNTLGATGAKLFP